jgi:hypothetical protein
MLNAHVEFKSDKFHPYDNENIGADSKRWGKRLAEYLFIKLKENSIIVGDVSLEQWGWSVPIKEKGFQIWVGCGNISGRPDSFLCFIETMPPLKNSKKKIDVTEEVIQLFSVINDILTSDHDIKDLKWWTR